LHCLKAFPQLGISHLKGRFPVCVLLCVIREPDVLKAWLHPTSSQGYGRLLV